MAISSTHSNGASVPAGSARNSEINNPGFAGGMIGSLEAAISIAPFDPPNKERLQRQASPADERAHCRGASFHGIGGHFVNVSWSMTMVSV